MSPKIDRSHFGSSGRAAMGPALEKQYWESPAGVVHNRCATGTMELAEPCPLQNSCKFSASSFSAVSKRNFARKYAFDSIFQALQDFLTCICTIPKSFFAVCDCTNCLYTWTHLRCGLGAETFSWRMADRPGVGASPSSSQVERE